MLEQTSKYLTPRAGQSRSTTPDTRQRSPSVDRGLANEQEDFAQQYSYPSRRLWDTVAIPE